MFANFVVEIRIKNMKKLFVICCLGISSVGASAQLTDSWDQAWINPPISASPGCYYYWDTGNISKYGITKDLEAMKAIGIDEPFVANVVGKRAKPGPVKVFTEDWWNCMVHAANEAKRLGMHIGYFNCPGWSQSGGPWVKPTETMRYLISRETRVNDGKKLNLNIKELFDSISRKNLQLVSVQAFPVPLYDDFRIADLRPKVQAEGLEQAAKLFDGEMATCVSSKNKVSTITLSLSKADTFRSLQIYPADRPMKGYVVMEAEDGKGGWKEVCRMAIDRDKLDTAVGPMTEGALTANFPDVTASQFRFVFHTDKGIKLREISLNKAARLACSTEKQLGKLWPYPEVTATCYNWPVTVQPNQSSLTVPLNQVKDLTSMVDGQGNLQWRSPKGKWVVLVTAMSPTNVFNSPCIPEASGYEIDKMNKKIAEAHVDSFIGKLMARIPAESKNAVRHVVADSYEKGAENWTDGMAKDFVARYGYDPMPYLPVLTGRIVEDAEHSERFLWDLRRFIADRIATEYIGGLRDRSHHYGLKLWMENYGHWGYPGEFLNYGGASDEVSGEYWVTKPQRGPVEVRCASSAAHIYGKQRVSAESFTDSGTTFNTQPDQLKARGDWAMCQGINHYVLHVYLHQPDDRKPGITAWFGTDFNRNNTWFSRAKSWVDYLRRSCAMLQQGHPVADVAYYIGENTPKMTGEQTPAMPNGYDFDFINAEVLMKATVAKNHRILLPSGVSYAVLVLPSDNTMRPAVAAKIAELMKQGANVVGNAPETSPSLEDYPRCDSLVAQYAQRLSSLLSPEVPLDETLHRLGWIEDCKTPAGFLYTHRQEGDRHIYFVSNQNGKVMDADIAFRVEGMLPELWDAVSGKRNVAFHYHEEKGKTIVPLHFESNGSWFVVFRNKKPSSIQTTSNIIVDNVTSTATKQAVPDSSKSSILLTIDRPWKVTFRPTYAPAFESEFNTLADWSTNENPGIKYFSGTAVYENSFTYKPKKKEQAKDVCLDLGGVKGMATMRINGVELPTLWTAPYRQSVAPYLKKGKNRVEIEVVNCWWNRLAGDAKPGSKPVTWTTNKVVNAKSKLMSSGLLGPVSLIISE